MKDPSRSSEEILRSIFTNALHVSFGLESADFSNCTKSNVSNLCRSHLLRTVVVCKFPSQTNEYPAWNSSTHCSFAKSDILWRRYRYLLRYHKVPYQRSYAVFMPVSVTWGEQGHSVSKIRMELISSGELDAVFSMQVLKASGPSWIALNTPRQMPPDWPLIVITTVVCEHTDTRTGTISTDFNWYLPMSSGSASTAPIVIPAYCICFWYATIHTMIKAYFGPQVLMSTEIFGFY